MRNLIYWVHTSVDGFVNGPNGEFDWARMGPELSAYSDALNERVDTLLYGRPVWEMMVGYWPTADTDSPDPHSNRFAPFWRATPKIVFSHTYEGDDWSARVIRDDLRAEVTALKSEPGRDLLLTGGAGLAATLTALRLIDEYHVAVHPVVLGGGSKLFGDGKERLTLETTGSRLLDGQIAVTSYRLT